MTEYREVVVKRIDEALKRRIVEEIESGRISQSEASRTYGISRTVIQKWLKQYGKLRYRTRIVEVVMSDEKEKIAELQRALAEAHLKVRFLEHIIDFANDEYKTDLKKNFGTKASGGSKEKNKESRRRAK